MKSLREQVKFHNRTDCGGGDYRSQRVYGKRRLRGRRRQCGEKAANGSDEMLNEVGVSGISALVTV